MAVTAPPVRAGARRALCSTARAPPARRAAHSWRQGPERRPRRDGACCSLTSSPWRRVTRAAWSTRCGCPTTCRRGSSTSRWRCTLRWARTCWPACSSMRCDRAGAGGAEGQGTASGRRAGGSGRCRGAVGQAAGALRCAAATQRGGSGHRPCGNLPSLLRSGAERRLAASLGPPCNAGGRLRAAQRLWGAGGGRRLTRGRPCPQTINIIEESKLVDTELIGLWLVLIIILGLAGGMGGRAQQHVPGCTGHALATDWVASQ